ncbi:hypothetical protein JJQ72_13050 [Paenibacillus sp. F411]|uniref:hypothetical protein n=1 Tax=Paenibacillus sp. F411 TaxID=2820239 RepID=UPI001AAEBAF3|nr:hypothetical protein [Paenibacillus sp. F411]MBO2944899.1 hypothetical protein [Paenibacillus sp. F411]
MTRILKIKPSTIFIWEESWGSSTAAKSFRSQEIALLKARKFQDLVQLEVSGLLGATLKQ